MKHIYLVYAPLVLSILLVGLGAVVYYLHRYGGIKDSSYLNKYKPSRNNILIKLKLFKYDNNFNYFLLIPYLIAWNLFFAILILYIIYWCGVTFLEELFKNHWVIIALMEIAILFMGYSAVIDNMIGNSGGWDSPDFSIDNGTTKDEIEKTEKDIKED